MKSNHRTIGIFVACILTGIIVLQAILIFRCRRELDALAALLGARAQAAAAARASTYRASVSAPVTSIASDQAASRGVPFQAEGLDFRQKVIRSEGFQKNLFDVIDDRLKRRYQRLFLVLRLSPTQERDLWQLLAQGLLSPELIPSADHRKRATLEEAQTYYREHESKIRQVIGDENYRRFRDYQNQLPANNTLEDISMALAATGNPLDFNGLNSLRGIFLNAPSPASGPNDLLPSVDAVRAAVSGSMRAPFPPGLLGSSTSWLTPAQRIILVDIQVQQQAIQRAETLKDSLNLPLQLPEFSLGR